MIFQKKIIIGSIMSFIATAIGVIAVFFPDLLNMQKDKIEELEITINSPQDLIELTNFLDNREDDNKVFELNLKIPDGHHDGLPKFKKSYWVKDKGFSYTFNNEDSYQEGKKFFSIDIVDTNNKDENYKPELSCVASWEYIEGKETTSPCQNRISYRFPMNELGSSMVGVKLKGYFLIDDSHAAGYDFYDIVYFQSISKEQVKLKNY